MRGKELADIRNSDFCWYRTRQTTEAEAEKGDWQEVAWGLPSELLDKIRSDWKSAGRATALWFLDADYSRLTHV